MSSKIKLARYISLFIGLAVVPMFWNACGQVAFDAGSSSLKAADCGKNPTDAACLPPPHPVSQSVAVKSNNSDVDILFVVDNSGSMDKEQVGIGNKVSGFLNKLTGLNWRIALTTTDPRAMTAGLTKNDPKRPWGDGQLRPFDADNGSQYILKSDEVNAADAQSLLANAVNVGILGSGDERGINAAYRAVERFSAGSVGNRDFFRTDARLAIVLISDEDECSEGYEKCSGDNTASIPANLLAVVHQRLGIDKVISFNSIIYKPGDANCTTGAYEGKTYEALTKLTNGSEGSVCDADYTTPLANIGSKVVELIKSVTLSCAPVDMNGDGVPELKVTLADGTVMTSGFTVGGATVAFNNALPEGTHQFDYNCR